MIKAEGRIERQVEEREAQSGHALREDLLISERHPFAQEQRERGGGDPQGDAHAGANPLVVSRVFEKKRHAEQEGDDRDAVQPVESELSFERSFGEGRWRRARFDRHGFRRGWRRRSDVR
jgi:hypothetical protein